MRTRSLKQEETEEMFVLESEDEDKDERESQMSQKEKRRSNVFLVYDESDGETYGKTRAGRVCHRPKRFLPVLVEKNEYEHEFEDDIDTDEEYEVSVIDIESSSASVACHPVNVLSDSGEEEEEETPSAFSILRTLVHM